MSVVAVPITTGGMTAARAWLTTALGGNTLDVELPAPDLNQCVADALRVLNRERPPLAWGTLTAAAATGVFPIRHPGLYGIVDVDWAVGVDCNAACDPFAYEDGGYGMGLGGAGIGVGFAGTYGERLQIDLSRQQARQLTGRDVAWEQRWVRADDGTPTLNLILSDVPAGAGVMYEYVWHLTADDDEATGVSRVPPNDVDWVFKYALSRAKQILGRVLRKYGGGVNMPDGGTEQLDGDALTQEGVNEQQALEQAVRERRRPILPHRG